MAANSVMLTKTQQQRILDNSRIVESGCWEWTGSLTHDGYGRCKAAPGRGAMQTTAHRASYFAFCGPVSRELQIDHLCRNRACVNPEHLEAVTPSVNILRSTATEARLRMYAETKTHCPKGHAYDEANTSWHGNKRKCRTCHRAQQAAYLARKAAS